MTEFFATRTESTRDDWQTPLYIVSCLGKFDLDPAANVLNPTRLAMEGYTVNGLTKPWTGRIWLNPPYGAECRNWLQRLASHGNGIALIPPRVGSKWFHRAVFKTCDAILFLEGRIAFLDGGMNPVVGNNADSILIAFGDENVEALRSCGLAGEFWDKRQK
jgi:hypothetical protein